MTDYSVTFRDRNGVYHRVVITGASRNDVEYLVEIINGDLVSIDQRSSIIKPGQPHLYTQVAMEYYDRIGVSVNEDRERGDIKWQMVRKKSEKIRTRKK